MSLADNRTCVQKSTSKFIVEISDRGATAVLADEGNLVDQLAQKLGGRIATTLFFQPFNQIDRCFDDAVSRAWVWANTRRTQMFASEGLVASQAVNFLSSVSNMLAAPS
ncbi:MAG: hypothetical protein NWP98_09785 [Erythrobacter sp.]|nr:hypothetical protein [Erythrobacter sp.]